MKNRVTLGLVTASAATFGLILAATFRYWSPILRTGLLPGAQSTGTCLKDRVASPLPLSPVPLPGYELSASSRSLLLTQIARACRAKFGSQAVRIHTLRLRNIAKEAGLDPKDQDVYEVLLRSMTDSEEYERLFHGVPILFDTVYGAGYRTRLGEDKTDPPELAYALGGMTHVDKVLSTLGELGLPLNTELLTHSGSRKTVADVLEDSLQRWHPKRENEWTLVAYCAYLRGQRDWVGTTSGGCDVDQVLESVLDQTDSACHNTHRIYSLAKACARSRQTHGFFDEALVRRAERELLRVSRVLTSKQHATGYWDVDWDDQHRVADLGNSGPTDLSLSDPRQRIVVTGHMLEWFAIIEERLRPEPEVIRRATAYIEGQLRDSPEEYLTSAYLPATTHAVRALSNLSDARPRNAQGRD